MATVIAHWDEVEPRRQECGHLGARWRDLGRAAGSVAIGVRRIEMAPGEIPTPAHSQGAEEELFFVLSGSGLSWQDDATHEVRVGDCLLHLPGGPAHTLRAGRGGLDVLAFGERLFAEIAHLPRAGVLWAGASWVSDAEQGGTPWEREAAAGAPEFAAPSPRPSTIVNLADIELVTHGRGRSTIHERDLGAATGSRSLGCAHVTIPAGAVGWPPHVHSAEEELYVVLGGAGVVELGDETTPIRAGSIIGRPAGTRTAHRLCAVAGTDVTYLVCSNRDSRDVAYYPRSGKLNYRAFGVIGRIQPADYWDGELD